MIYAVLLAMLLLGFLYKWGDLKKRFSPRATTLFKGAATACAGALALYAAFKSGSPYAALIAAGLFTCAVADMVLETHFKAGMLVFAAGHLFYCAAFLQKGFPLLSLLVWGALLILLFAVIHWGKARGPEGEKMAPFLAYGGLLSLMFSLSLPIHWTVALGAALFLISDALIFYRQMAKKSLWSDLSLIALYYLAQYLIALSALMVQ